MKPDYISAKQIETELSERKINYSINNKIRIYKNSKTAAKALNETPQTIYSYAKNNLI